MIAARFLQSALALMLLALAATTAAAQGSLLQEMYGQGVHAFFLREHEKAYDLFSMAIEQGTRDPRVYYFRGFVHSRMGRPEEAREDFEKGAELEAAGEAFQIDIGAALQRVQGPVRLQLENLRYQARLQAQLLQARQREERYEALSRDEERVLRDPTLRDDTDLPTPPEHGDDPFAADDRPAVAPADVDEEPFTRETPEVKVTDDPFADPDEPVQLPSPEDEPEALAQPQQDEVDLLDAPPVDPVDPVDEDDPFGAPPVDPVGPVDEDDPFGAPPVDPVGPVDEDDPFGAPPVDPVEREAPFGGQAEEPSERSVTEDDPFRAEEVDEPMEDLFGDDPDPVPPSAPGGTLFDAPDSDPFEDSPIGGSSAAVGGVDATGAGAPPPEEGLLPGDTVPAHGEPPEPTLDPALPAGGLPPQTEEPADVEARPGEPFDDPFGGLDELDAAQDEVGAADEVFGAPLPDGGEDFEQDGFDTELPEGQQDGVGDPFGDPDLVPEVSRDDNDLFGGDEDPFANPPQSELGDVLPGEQADPFADDEDGGQNLRGNF